MYVIRDLSPRIVVHVGALFPLALIGWDLAQGQLTANPIEQIQLRTGKTALVLLALSLACRPAANLLGLSQLLTLRRLLGLYAFLYVSLHLLNFVGIDYGFNFRLIQKDALVEKRFIAAGLLAFLCLLPAALTSTEGWKRRLGRGWCALHFLVYPGAVLAVTHYVWQTKIDLRQPILYASVVVLILAFRLPGVDRVFLRR
ncbi:MAG: ferric reductase-like transmembrane domain-containing protein [Chloroflexi bacterium]|nr:ferric reductase-like transmembrane domain-containing protein [Chloroflexota bacterium]